MTNQRPDGYKDFVAILLLHRLLPAQEILRAIEEIGVDVVTAEQIKSYFLHREKQDLGIPDELQKYKLLKQNPARYDVLAGRVVH
ncbi:MAG: hypothetical protein K6T31_06370 [Alicyclobacillus sp.]|nr:hypothetical protein [Alicyclobacillus sp.]